MANIMIIEPHALLRLGLVQLLADLGPDVTLQSQDYPVISAQPQTQWATDLVLLSLYNPDEIARQVAAVEATFKPVAIIAMGEEKIMPPQLAALSSRLAGYLSISCAPEMLLAAVRLVLAGGKCFPPISAPPVASQATAPAAVSNTLPASAATTDDLMRPYTPPRWPPVAETAPPPPTKAPPKKEMAEHEMLGLTPRQYEVLVLLARGYPMKTVGRCLNISVATAKAHTETLYQRLDVHNRNAAVYAAVSRGAKLGWACMGGDADQGSANCNR